MSTRERLKARLEKKEASLAIAESTYDSLLAEENESYRFDSGEGSQSTKKRKIEDIKSQIDQLESEIDALRRRLKGQGLTRISLRRAGRGRF